MNDFDKINKKLGDHEKRILDLEKLVKSKSTLIILDGEKVVLSLINSGYFNEPKKYGEMIKELKIQASFNKKHNYKIILKKLTRENKLGRKSAHKQWLYYKK